jgi:hypothetical protein
MSFSSLHFPGTAFSQDQDRLSSIDKYISISSF